MSPKKKRNIFLLATSIAFLIFAFHFIFNSFGDGEIQKARVINIKNEKTEYSLGARADTLIQEIDAVIVKGPEKNKTITLINDYLPLLKGDYFFVSQGGASLEFGGADTASPLQYGIIEKSRAFSLIFFALLFLATILIFAGKQGVRSVISLGASFFVIFYALLPALQKGGSPILISILLSFLILFFAIFFTHGFNKESVVSFAGTSIGVALTGILAQSGIALAELSGFASHESVYLNLLSNGTMDIRGILLAGIIIGVLGVVDDIAVTQSAVVSELWRANRFLKRSEVYKRALRVGREHVSALVNTLALAYTGASLPLLLLFTNTGAPLEMTISREVFATEILRTIIGSIGLILTVPITTFIAAVFLKNKNLASEEGDESGHITHHSHHGH